MVAKRDAGTDFTIDIAPDGRISAEHSREAEQHVGAILGGIDRPAPRPPRLLPLPDEILTPEETAAHLGIPKKTIIFLCAEGRLEGAFKAGRRWRVPGRAVRKLAGAP
jgi:excisionase family DNA binding protein